MNKLLQTLITSLLRYLSLKREGNIDLVYNSSISLTDQFSSYQNLHCMKASIFTECNV